eukprot:scaffold4189_cov378-Prasinococcus_capsulatus_cf.AAC.5
MSVPLPTPLGPHTTMGSGFATVPLVSVMLASCFVLPFGFTSWPTFCVPSGASSACSPAVALGRRFRNRNICPTRGCKTRMPGTLQNRQEADTLHHRSRLLVLQRVWGRGRRLLSTATSADTTRSRRVDEVTQATGARESIAGGKLPIT